MRKLTLVLMVLVALVTASVGQNQPVPNSVRAISFGQWSVQSQGPNSFSFSPTGICYVNGGFGTAFFPFATNAPVFIQDNPSDSNNETVTPSSVTTPGASGCGFAASPANSHTQFYVSSGTGGLQEALNAIKTQATPAQVIVLDKAWFSYISAISGTASSVIAAASGSTSVNLVDQTQSPWQWYSWNGSSYIKMGLGQSATYGSIVDGQFFGYKNTSLTAIAAPTAGAFGIALNSSGIAAGTYRLAQTCVDALGGETLISTDSSTTVTTDSTHGTITSAAPTCAAGSVGWRLYISAASGGTSSEILYKPSDAGCTASLVGVRPSCALTSAASTAALVTGTSKIPDQATAYAMSIAAQDTVPTPYLKSWPPFAVTGVQTFTTAYTLAQFSFPAGYLNQIGKAVQVCGNYNLTPSATGTDAVTVLGINAFNQTANTLITWTSGALTNAAYEAPFCFVMTTAVTGASGTVEIHGTMNFALASTGVAPQRGFSDANTSTAAIGDLTKEITISLQSTPGTSNVTQGQMRQLTITPLN